MRQFVIVAIPSSSLEDACSNPRGVKGEEEEEIEETLPIHWEDHVQRKLRGELCWDDGDINLGITQVTRLVDQEDGIDYIVMGLWVGGCDRNQDDDNDEGGENYAWNIDTVPSLHPEAQVWVTSATALPLAPPYGWSLDTFVPASNNPNDICRTLQTYGMAILKRNEDRTNPNETNPQNAATTTAAAAAIDTTTASRETATATLDNCQTDNLSYAQIIQHLKDHVQILEQAVHELHPHIVLGETPFGFSEYTSRGMGRFEVLLHPDTDLYQRIRCKWESSAGWMDTICQYLQTEPHRIRLNISCVYSRPGATDQEWHTDGAHYNNASLAAVATTTIPVPQPYALCIFVPLIPLTHETGYTRFWPQSHLYPHLLGLARAADALQATVDAVHLQPGDCLWYDYTTWHKGVQNTSTNTERPILQFLYSCDWYKEVKNYGKNSVFVAEGPKAGAT